MSKALTVKQQLFVEEYIVDFNGTRAAIKAGYSEKSARKTGSENVTKPDIQKAIAKAIEKRNEKTETKAEYVLTRLKEIDQLDILDIMIDDLSGFKSLSEWPKAWRTSISGIDINELFEFNDGKKDLVGLVKKIKWPDKVRNLELLGKHVDVQAWKEKAEANVVVNNVMQVPTCTDISEWEIASQKQQAEVLEK